MFSFRLTFAKSAKPFLHLLYLPLFNSHRKQFFVDGGLQQLSKAFRPDYYMRVFP